MKEVDKTAIRHDLTDAFILYQHRLDYPFPHQKSERSAKEMIDHDNPRYMYQTDPIFRRKVDSLVYGVMEIIDKHV